MSIVHRQGDYPCWECRTCAYAEFVKNDELLLLNLQTYAFCSRSVHTTRNAAGFQSVRSSRTVCRYHQQQSSRPIPHPPPPNPKPPTQQSTHPITPDMPTSPRASSPSMCTVAYHRHSYTHIKAIIRPSFSDIINPLKPELNPICYCWHY